MWPVAEGEKQEKVLFEAKVAEIAKRRDVKNPPAKQGVVPEWLVWVVAGVGLLTVILVFPGRIRLPKRAKRTGGSGKDISVITQIDRADKSAGDPAATSVLTALRQSVTARGYVALDRTPRLEDTRPRTYSSRVTSAVSWRGWMTLARPAPTSRCSPASRCSRATAPAWAIELVLADFDDDIFDGIVIDGSALPGGLRLADAVQVAEIYERGVVLSVDAAGAEALPEPTDNPGTLVVDGLEDVDKGEFREKLRRAWETMSGKGPGKSADV